jgi:hypothetical protein
MFSREGGSPDLNKKKPLRDIIFHGLGPRLRGGTALFIHPIALPLRMSGLANLIASVFPRITGRGRADQGDHVGNALGAVGTELVLEIKGCQRAFNIDRQNSVG